MTEETLAAVTPFDAQKRATELAILDALRSVVDPEIGMNVVELALIRQVLVGETESEVKMILTTPFCPYAGSMLAQVKEAAESVLEHPVKVTLLAERWDPKDAGYAMVTVADQLLQGKAVTQDLAIEGLGKADVDMDKKVIRFNKILEVTKDNAKSLGF